jgi:nuclear control of ATPase protein 2
MGFPFGSRADDSLRTLTRRWRKDVMSTRSSSFAQNYIHSLFSVTQLSPNLAQNSFATEGRDDDEAHKDDEKLEGLLVQLKDPSDRESLLSAIKELHDSDAEATSMAAEKDDSSSMRAAVETRIVVDLYAEALDQWLREAIELDSEAEWWDNVGRTYTSVLSYLLASELFKFSSFDP